MSNLHLTQEIQKIAEKLPKQEYTLCKGLKQPFNNTNSGSRKIMQGIQMEQATQLLDAEVPVIMTGYETMYGEASSNFIKTDRDFTIVNKIKKYSFKDDHYFVILFDSKNGYIDMLERKSYTYISEMYGYLFDFSFIDSIPAGATVPAGSVIKRPNSFDEYGNKEEGLNLVTMYVASEETKEDPIVVSESTSKRFGCPLIDKVEIRINDNDILLNLYGEGKEYKTFPDIGENVKNSLICALRRELKDEEALFSQSWERLKEIMMNDKQFTVDDGGTIIDIDVRCNNPEKLESSMYNTQIKKYYDETIRFAKEVVDCINPLLFSSDGEETGVKMSYNMEVLYETCKAITNGGQYIYDKVFSNIIMYIYVLHRKPLQRGDKITDRYGGKGCISVVKPDNMMPHYLKDGQWKPVDVIYNMCTCINRLNDGQLFETSITFIGGQLVDYVKAHNMNHDQAFMLFANYISILDPEHFNYLYDVLCYKVTYDPKEDMDWEDKKFKRDIWVESILHAGYIMLSLEPISSNMSIDKLREIYDAFPFLKKYTEVCVPQKNSNGEYRMIRTRRPLVIGYKYIFRLKQLAEEKFSAVSLASTNIRNENSKSRLSKIHNARFPSTPVRVFGEMESSTLAAHLGINYFYQEFMLISSSPMARRLHEELLTGDPFKFDIQLSEDCTSQTSDIGQAYLKTLGAKFRFIKVRKYKDHPVWLDKVYFNPMIKYVVNFIPEDIRGDKEKEEAYIKMIEQINENMKKGDLTQVVKLFPNAKSSYPTKKEYEEKLKKLKLI